MSKPKLLFVGAFPPQGSEVYGGQVTSCRALLDSSFSEHFDLLLFDTTQLSNPPPGLGVRVFRAVRRLFVFVPRLIVGKPDVVLLFAAVGASLLEKGLMARLAKISGIPALLFPRGGEVMDKFHESGRARTWISWAFKGADFVLCQGPAWQRFVTTNLGVSLDRAPIISNWTATNALLAIGEKRLRNIRKGRVKFLFLGWVERDKGIFELLEAFSRLVKRNEATLIIAGTGHAERDAQDVVAKCGLTQFVRFAGGLQGQKLHQVIAESDVLVLPSWVEGFPNAVIEAMAAGLAVVVTTVGTIPDVLTHEEHALLISPRSVDSLEKALQRIVTDEDLRCGLASRGHALAKGRFAVEPSVKRLVEVINQAIAESVIKSRA